MTVSPRIVLYRKVSELERELHLAAQKPSCIFFVPTSRDRKLLQDVIFPHNMAGQSAPAIWRWDDLIRQFETFISDNSKGGQNNYIRQIDPPDHWLIVRYIVKDFLESQKGNTLLPPGVWQTGFISTLGDHFRELLREAVSPETLGLSLECGNCNREKCPHIHTPEGILCHLFHLYVEYLERWHLVDSAQIPLIALRFLKEGPSSLLRWVVNRHFVFVGFLSFNSSQIHLLSHLSSLGATITIYTPQTGLDNFYTTVDQFPGALVESLPSSGTLNALRITSGSPRMEMETLARELVLWKNQKGYITEHNILPSTTSWQKMGMVIDSPCLALAEEVLTRYHIPYSIHEGLTVEQTPLWDLARRIWSAGEKQWPVEETWNILREPSLAGREIQTPPPTDIFSLSEGGWIDLLKHRAPERGVLSFKKMCQFIKTMEKGGTPADLLSALYTLAAESPSWGNELSLWVIDHPELDESVRRLQAALRETEQKVESLGELQDRIGNAGKVHFSGSEAISFLHHWASIATIWLPAAIEGTLSLFVGTPPVLTQKSLWIMPGTTASMWPGKISESSLLPDDHKMTLHEMMGTERGHLPLLKEKREQREALFRRLLACGEKAIIISSPLADGSGKPLPPSPFIGKSFSEKWIYSKEEIPPLERTLSHLLPKKEEPAIEGVEIREDAYPYTGRQRYLPEERTEVPVSPKGQLSKLDEYMDCPFRFANLNCLNIDEPVSSGLDLARSGSTLHQLWNKVWETYEETGESLSLLARRYWEEIVEDAYPDLLQRSSLTRHNERLLQQTLKLADLQQIMEENGLEKLRYRQYREMDLPLLSVNGVPFTGRADRVEFLNDGRIIILDYKLGSGNGRNKNLQLAAYTLATQEGEGTLPAHMPNLRVVGTLYLCHSDTSIVGAVEEQDILEITGCSNARNGNTLEDLIEATKVGLNNMAQSLRSGIYAPNYDSKACHYCSLNLMCRKSELASKGKKDEDK